MLTILAILDCQFGESIISRTQVQLWYKRFKKGREDVNDDTLPSTSTTDVNIKALKKIILYNRRISIRGIADNVGTSFGLGQARF